MFYDRKQKRQEMIKKMLSCGMTEKQISSLHRLFGVNKPAIRTDFIELRNHKIPEGFKVYPTGLHKKLIRKRDGNECQYCGIISENTVIEHVIATANGGYAAMYNLVVACQSCNIKKRDKYWIPKNIEVLRLINPEWVDKIYENYEKTNRH